MAAFNSRPVAGDHTDCPLCSHTTETLEPAVLTPEQQRLLHDWLADPTKNPRTGRTIVKDGDTYKRLEREFGQLAAAADPERVAAMNADLLAAARRQCEQITAAHNKRSRARTMWASTCIVTGNAVLCRSCAATCSLNISRVECANCTDGAGERCGCHAACEVACAGCRWTHTKRFGEFGIAPADFLAFLGKIIG